MRMDIWRSYIVSWQKIKFSFAEILAERYFAIIVTVYFVTVFLTSVSVVVISSLMLLLILLFSLREIRYKDDWDVIAYLLILIASGFMYLKSGLPIGLFFRGIAYSALPISMYFVNKKRSDYFYIMTTSALIISFLLALVFYWWAPPYYYNFLLSRGFIRGKELIDTDQIYRVASIRAGFQGLYGVTQLGTLSAVCTIYYYGLWMVYDKKILKTYRFLLFLISLACLLATGRRSAIMITAIILVIESVVFYKKNNNNRTKLCLMLISGGMILLIAFVLKREQFLNWIVRLVHVPSAISERIMNWRLNLKLLPEYWVCGRGLGSGGHNASSLGYIAVHDNSYLMTFVENGILGVGLFLYIIIRRFIRLSRMKRKSFENFISLLITFVFLVQAIGSNVWEFPALASLFWYALSCSSYDSEKRSQSCLSSQGV